MVAISASRTYSSSPPCFDGWTLIATIISTSYPLRGRFLIEGATLHASDRSFPRATLWRYWPPLLRSFVRSG